MKCDPSFWGESCLFGDSQSLWEAEASASPLVNAQPPAVVLV